MLRRLAGSFGFSSRLTQSAYLRGVDRFSQIRFCGTDAGNHGRDPCSHETLPQNLGEVGVPEWNVALLVADRRKAAVQDGQALVDVHALRPTLTLGVGLSRGFRSRQIHQIDLGFDAHPVLVGLGEDQAENGVRSRALGVLRCGPRAPSLAALLEEGDGFLLGVYDGLDESRDREFGALFFEAEWNLFLLNV